ncbi:hypothetical protein [Brevundimonas sp.]
MIRQTIGEAVAAQLYAAETAIDMALAETAGLAARLPAARADACLSATTGQKAFDSVAAAIGALASARGHIVQTHVTLGALARKMGLDTLAIGPLDKPGDTPPVDTGIGTGPDIVNNTLTSVVNKSLLYGAI